MGRKMLDDLGELQRGVMEVVWGLGEASVHEVIDGLGREKRPAYTTVLSAMQKLEKAGWLEHRAQGKIYFYRATCSRDDAGAKSVRRFVERVFEGDAVVMFQHLMEESDLSDEKLAELRKMIDKKRKG